MVIAIPISKKPSSFIYEDLVSHVEIIQNQIIQIEKILDYRWTDEKRKHDEIKSRSLIFLDPYGNRTVKIFMDHELINKITNEYKKNYVPKYLQQWIKIGTINENIISSLATSNSTVSNYMDGCQFITFVETTILVSCSDIHWLHHFVLPVLLTDNTGSIELRIKQHLQITDMELKLCIITGDKREVSEKDWDENMVLKSEDTIMSCQLYQNKCVLLAKIIRKKTNDIFTIHVKLMTGKTVDLNVYSSMKIFILKELLQYKEGIPPDQQRLIRSGIIPDDEKTLQWYNIQNGSMLQLVLRLRGGMYHFTSGRWDFDSFPYDRAEAIRNVLRFKIKNMNQVSLSSSTELQNFVLQAQSILSNLYDTIKEYSAATDLPNLKHILLPIATNDDDD